MTKTEASEVFKRAKAEAKRKNSGDAREMDAAECKGALRLVAGVCVCVRA